MILDVRSPTVAMVFAQPDQILLNRVKFPFFVRVPEAPTRWSGTVDAEPRKLRQLIDWRIGGESVIDHGMSRLAVEVKECRSPSHEGNNW
jgi:hypothetical protein